MIDHVWFSPDENSLLLSFAPIGVIAVHEAVI
jgi:hypothetical protein